MRKFILHTYSKTKSFDLNNITSLAVDPTGLGNSFNVAYKDSEQGKHLVNVTPNFEPITLKIYFNADGTNGYTNYKGLMLFLAECGTGVFLFEYQDGVTDKYCDVVLKSATKTEITEESIFCETFTFERQSHWYERIEDSFTLRNTTADTTRFPLGFPFGFYGKLFKKKHFISNPFYKAAPITITIEGQIRENIRIFIATLDDKIVAEIKFTTNNPEGRTIIIDPNTKKINVVENGMISNGYGLTDKTQQSFLYLPQGEYYIGSNMDEYDAGQIKFAIKRYLYD